MKPAHFEYERPASLEEAIAALTRGAGDARALAGGQTLGPMLNLRLAQPTCLIDLCGIEPLKRITRQGDRILIGSGVTHAAIEDGAVEGITGELLAEVAAQIAYRAIRNRGTIGGSLAHADPSADWIVAMTLLDAAIHVAGPDGSRVVPMRAFMSGAFTTALRENELIAAIELAELSPAARWGYYRVCRKVGEFPEAVAGVLLDPGRSLARIVIGSIGGPPQSLPALADAVAREGAACATVERIEAAVRAVAPGIDPIDLQLHRAAVRRAIARALAT